MINDLLFTIGINAQSNEIETPIGYSDPPKRYFCSECGHINKCVYKKTTKTFECLFCKCCTIEKGVPFLACERCNFKIKGISFIECKHCEVSRNSDTMYCPNCGTKKDEK